MDEGYVTISEGAFDLRIGSVKNEVSDGISRTPAPYVIDGYAHPGRELELEVSKALGKIETRLGFRPGQTLVLGSMPTQDHAVVFVVVHVAEDDGEPA